MTDMTVNVGRDVKRTEDGIMVRSFRSRGAEKRGPSNHRGAFVIVIVDQATAILDRSPPLSVVDDILASGAIQWKSLAHRPPSPARGLAIV